MASANLARTPSSAGSTTTGTISFWIKGNLATGANQNLYSVSDGLNTWQMWLNVNGQPDFHAYNGSSYVARVHPARKLRDTNAWYHIVCTIDTTNATAGDRLRLYINGERYTGTWTAEVQPTQNLSIIFCKNSSTRIGSEWDNSDYFEGNMTHFHLIDGTAYDASTFGETDTTTGIWKPKTSPSVTYGTNGFFLKFDNSGNMGLDSSGQSNNFTTNGTIIQNKDTPSNVFATLNPLGGLNGNAKGTYSNTNTTWVSSTTDQDACNSTLAVNGGGGKYYCEMKCVSKTGGYYNPGVFSAVSSAYNSANPSVFVRSDGVIYNNGSQTQSGLASVSDGDIFGMAYDASNATHTIQFYLNGSTYGSAENITNAPDYPLFFGDGTNSGSVSNTVSFNFGNGYFGTTAVSSAQNPTDGIGIFEYSVPSGFRALCTKSFNAQEYS